MSSPRHWKIVDFAPHQDIFNCKGNLDRTIQSYSETICDNVADVFNHLLLQSQASMRNLNSFIASNIEQDDNGEPDGAVYYHVTIDFEDVTEASELSHDRTALIEIIEDWCAKCNLPSLRGYRAYAIKRPKISTVSDFLAAPRSGYAKISFDVVFLNAVWYSGRRVTTGCLTGVANADFQVLATTIEELSDYTVNVEFVSL